MAAPRKAETRNCTVNVRLTAAEHDELEAHCREVGATKSGVIQMLLQDHFKRLAARAAEVAEVERAFAEQDPSGSGVILNLTGRPMGRSRGVT